MAKTKTLSIKLYLHSWPFEVSKENIARTMRFYKEGGNNRSAVYPATKLLYFHAHNQNNNTRTPTN